MSCDSPACDRQAYRNGYCREHADYLEQNTTLFHAQAPPRRPFASTARWLALILFIAAAVHP